MQPNFRGSVLEVLLHTSQVLFWRYNCEARADPFHNLCNVCHCMRPYMDWNERVAVRIRFVLCMMQTRTFMSGQSRSIPLAVAGPAGSLGQRDSSISF